MGALRCSSNGASSMSMAATGLGNPLLAPISNVVKALSRGSAGLAGRADEEDARPFPPVDHECFVALKEA